MRRRPGDPWKYGCVRRGTLPQFSAVRQHRGETRSLAQQQKASQISSTERGPQYLDLGEVEAPLAVCTVEGEVVAASPPALALMSKIGMPPADTPARLPESLLRLIRGTPLGKPIDWSPHGGEQCLGVTVYALGSSHFLLSMREIAEMHATLSYQVYRSTQQELARLLAGAAHDLRSPLSTITFNVEVLRGRWSELPPEQVQTLLDRIAACCKYQDGEISSLVESAQMADPVSVTLGELFDRVEDKLRPIFREEGARLRVKVDRNVRVRAAMLSLDHIFSNLLTNAIESSEHSVTVEVRSGESVDTGAVKSSGFSSSCCVPIWVADNGPGIAPEHLGRVFSPFFSTKASGTGIGLCLAREAARHSGGELRLVTGKRRGGACFEVLLPQDVSMVEPDPGELS